MSVRVGIQNTSVGSVIAGSSTQVAKIVVGTPIRKVSAGAFIISNLGGVDTTDAVDGAVLVYGDAQGKFVAKKELDETNFNGGQY